MKMLSLVFSFLFLVACQHPSTATAPRAPSSADLNKKILALLPAGQYNGKTPKGIKCNVNVTGFENSLRVSITPTNFTFDQDKGSSECMYTKACFAYDNSMKILDLDETISSVDVAIKRSAGGPDRASAKKMSIQVVRDFNNSGNTIIRVSESVGLFGLGSVEEICQIPQ